MALFDPAYNDAIRASEGFAPKAKWDYQQWTNGYGTKAAYPGEVITPDVAQARFDNEVGNASGLVNNFAPNAPQGVKAALSSLTFNAGPGWMNSGLGQAVKAGDWDAARQHFLAYNHAGGEVNPGLSQRRAQEATWFDGALPTTNTNTGNRQMPQSSQPLPPPSMLDKIRGGGLGAIIGAPGGVFPDAQGTPGQGYDLGMGLQRAGAALTGISNPSGGAAMMNAVNMPLFRQNYNVVTDALGNRYVVNTHTGVPTPFSNAVRTPGNSGGGAGGVASDTPTELKQSPIAQAATATESAKQDLELLKNMRTAADTAHQQNDLINNKLIPIIQDPSVSQGFGGEYRTEAKSAIKSLTGGAVDLGGVDAGQRLGQLGRSIGAGYLKQLGVQRLAGPEIALMAGTTIHENQPQGTNLDTARDMVSVNNRVIAMHKLAEEFAARNLPFAGQNWEAATNAIRKQYPTSSDTSALGLSGNNGLPKGVNSIKVMQ